MYNQRINSFGYSKPFDKVKGDDRVLRIRHIKIMNLEIEHMVVIQSLNMFYDLKR